MRGLVLQPLLGLLLLSSCSPAQQPLTTVPMRPDGHLMAVPLTVNRSNQWFMWDTGAPTLVIDPRLVDSIRIERRGQGSITGAGVGPVGIVHAAPVELHIGAESYVADDPWIIDLSAVPIPADVRGLVGADLWSRYAVRMDSQRKTLELFPAGTYRPSHDETGLPLIVKDNKMYVDAILDVKPGLTVTERLRVDTGSQESINAPVVAQAIETRRTTLGNGLGANFEGVSGRMQAAHLGPFTVSDVWGPGGKGPAIGMEILRRFVVTFDAKAGKIYLKPTPALTEPVPAPE